MPSYTFAEVEELLFNLIHDLRQPLSNIETSAYYLHVIAAQGPPRLNEQAGVITRQVDCAARLLTEAASKLGRLRDQRELETSRCRTNSVTAVVT